MDLSDRTCELTQSAQSCLESMINKLTIQPKANEENDSSMISNDSEIEVIATSETRDGIVKQNNGSSEDRQILHIIKHFGIGIVDFGEREYLAKCIHDGTTPVSRIDNISYILIGLDQDSEPCDYIFQTIDRSSIECTPDNDSSSSGQSEQDGTDACVIGEQVKQDDPVSSKIGTISWNMDREVLVTNETVYDIYSSPSNIKYITLIIDSTKFTKNDKYYLYLIEPSNDKIYAAFYIPDHLEGPNQYKIVLVLEKHDDNWVFRHINADDSIKSLDVQE